MEKHCWDLWDTNFANVVMKYADRNKVKWGQEVLSDMKKQAEETAGRFDHSFPSKK